VDSTEQAAIPSVDPENPLDADLISHIAEALETPAAHLISAIAQARRKWQAEKERFTGARGIQGGLVT